MRNEHFVVMLPVRFTAVSRITPTHQTECKPETDDELCWAQKEQKQDIDLLRGSQDEIDEFLLALEEDKLWGGWSD